MTANFCINLQTSHSADIPADLAQQPWDFSHPTGRNRLAIMVVALIFLLDLDCV
jgi:hypothetical protein